MNTEHNNENNLNNSFLDEKIAENINAFDKVTLSEDAKKRLTAIPGKRASVPFYMKSSFRRLTALAACLALVLTLSFTLSGGNKQESSFAPKTDDSETVASSKTPVVNSPSDAKNPSSGTVTEAPASNTTSSVLRPEYEYESDSVKEPSGKAPDSYPDGSIMDSEKKPGVDAPDIGEYDFSQPDYKQSLTAVELNDTIAFKEFAELVRSSADNPNPNDSFKGTTFAEYAAKRSLYPLSRVTVNVTANGKPASNVSVKGLDGQGNAVAFGKTDINGKAYLFADITSIKDKAEIVSVSCGGEDSYPVEDGSVTIELQTESHFENKLDLMLVTDTTGSMGDELAYLTYSLSDIVNRVAEQARAEIRLSVNFYRDDGDDYTVKRNLFTADLSKAVRLMSSESAMGGGDYAEIPDRALYDCICNSDWDDGAVKVCIVVLDAPPHDGMKVNENLAKVIAYSQENGIRIIPLLASGFDADTEFIMRTLAVTTGGTTAYLTDDSGIGNAHGDPTTSQELTVEKLNDLLVRVISSCLYPAS